MNPPGNLWGLKVPDPKGPGSFISAGFRKLAVIAIRCVFNEQINVQFYDGSGTGAVIQVPAKIEISPAGKTITIPANPNPLADGGAVFYVKACLEDGTECYVPVPVAGKIYRQRADIPGTAPTIDAGKVPDGTPELI